MPVVGEPALLTDPCRHRFGTLSRSPASAPFAMAHATPGPSIEQEITNLAAGTLSISAARHRRGSGRLNDQLTQGGVSPRFHSTSEGTGGKETDGRERWSSECSTRSAPRADRAGNPALPQPQGRDAPAWQAGAADPVRRSDRRGVHADLLLPGRGVQRDGGGQARAHPNPPCRASRPSGRRSRDETTDRMATPANCRRAVVSRRRLICPSTTSSTESSTRYGASLLLMASGLRYHPA